MRVINEKYIQRYLIWTSSPHECVNYKDYSINFIKTTFITYYTSLIAVEKIITGFLKV